MTSDLSALIARLEAAEAGSAELDYLIDEAFSEWRNLGGGWAAHKVTGERRRNSFDYPDPVTTSLDAALALAERVLPFYTATIVKHRTNGGEFKPSSQANLLCVYGEIREYHGHAPTPALALCIATLKAKLDGYEGEAGVNQ